MRRLALLDTTAMLPTPHVAREFEQRLPALGAITSTPPDAAMRCSSSALSVLGGAGVLRRVESAAVD